MNTTAAKNLADDVMLGRDIRDAADAKWYIAEMAAYEPDLQNDEMVADVFAIIMNRIGR